MRAAGWAHSPTCRALFSSRPVVSVAPMVDVTDYHWRHLARLIGPRVQLYTDMMVVSSRPDPQPHPLLPFAYPLCPSHHVEDFTKWNHPDNVVIQLGGDHSDVLIPAIRRAHASGMFVSANINMGCPAESARAGQHGVVLLKNEPFLNEQLPKIVQAGAELRFPVSVKMRIGVDEHKGLEWLLKTMRLMIVHAGVRTLIVHCRPAVTGLSTGDQLAVPLLNHTMLLDAASIIKQELGHLECHLELNGGVDSPEKVNMWLGKAPLVDGVMVGRWARDSVFDCLHQLNNIVHDIGGGQHRSIHTVSRLEVLQKYCLHLQRLPTGLPPLFAVRPLFSFFSKQQSARAWRRSLLTGIQAKREPLQIVQDAYAEFLRMTGRNQESFGQDESISMQA